MAVGAPHIARVSVVGDTRNDFQYLSNMSLNQLLAGFSESITLKRFRFIMVTVLEPIGSGSLSREIRVF